VLAIGLAIAGLAELGRGTAASPQGRMVSQVVVLEALPAGARVRADALGVVRVPARYAAPGVVADPETAVGRRVAVAVPSGELLAAPELATQTRLEAGRDVAVRVDAAAGLPAGDLAGVRADVFLATPGRRSDPTIVLSDVFVVAADRSDGAAVATLRLPAAAVATIIAAEGRGSLRLVIRSMPGAS
jgi:Flp pilus assembly protein CpaB